MSVYSVKKKGWRYDFVLKGIRYSDQWFKTKTLAKKAEAEKREEVLNPPVQPVQDQIPTGTTFLELVNCRLDYVKAYNSKRHYDDYIYMAKRWVKHWGDLECCQISRVMLERFILERNKVSGNTANKEIRYLKATFNFGIKKKLVDCNPVKEIEFLPVEKRIKYVPPPEDLEKVIAIAEHEVQDYLITIRDTMGRMSEINRLKWEDVNLKDKSLILYTRKKKGGHLTPRKVPMTQKLFEILSRRFTNRSQEVPWVFWHRYTDRKTGEKVTGRYKDRKKIMKTLCKKANVKYFRFHAIRHAGASLMDSYNVPLGSIQRILGHENRSTTEIYLHSICDSERLAISVLEQAQMNFPTNSHTDSHTGQKKVFSEN